MGETKGRIARCRRWHKDGSHGGSVYERAGGSLLAVYLWLVVLSTSAFSVLQLDWAWASYAIPRLFPVCWPLPSLDRRVPYSTLAGRMSSLAARQVRPLVPSAYQHLLGRYPANRDRS